MDKFGVAIIPIADLPAWRKFADEISAGDRAEAHRDTLRRMGVSAERAFHQPTPMGDLMVLVWEGVDSAGMAEALGGIAQDPQSDHERYIRDYVMPVIHKVDASKVPPPPAELVASITV